MTLSIQSQTFCKEITNLLSPHIDNEKFFQLDSEDKVLIQKGMVQAISASTINLEITGCSLAAFQFSYVNNLTEWVQLRCSTKINGKEASLNPGYQGAANIYASKILKKNQITPKAGDARGSKEELYLNRVFEHGVNQVVSKSNPFHRLQKLSLMIKMNEIREKYIDNQNASFTQKAKKTTLNKISQFFNSPVTKMVLAVSAGLFAFTGYLYFEQRLLPAAINFCIQNTPKKVAQVASAVWANALPITLTISGAFILTNLTAAVIYFKGKKGSKLHTLSDKILASTYKAFASFMKFADKVYQFPRKLIILSAFKTWDFSSKVATLAKGALTIEKVEREFKETQKEWVKLIAQ